MLVNILAFSGLRPFLITQFRQHLISNESPPIHKCHLAVLSFWAETRRLVRFFQPARVKVALMLTLMVLAELVSSFGAEERHGKVARHLAKYACILTVASFC